MKTKHWFLFSLLLLASSTSALAQRNSIEDRADQKVAELNELLVSVDLGAALTEDQTATIKGLYVQLFTEIRDIRRNGTGTDEEKDEQIRETRQAINKEINQEVLTREQRLAKRAAKADEDDGE